MKKAFNVSTAVVLLTLLYISSSCKKAGDPAPTPVTSSPVLTCPDVSVNRTSSAAVLRFYVNLSATSTSEASAKYSLVPGTALAPRDFPAAAGIVSIVAGQSMGYIDVPITGDSLRQPDLQFSVQFSEPKNCTLGTTSAKGTIVTMNGTYLTTDDAGFSTPLIYPGYSLIWSDEFTGSSINQSNWNFESGGSGWGNHELEYYTARAQNAFQSNGKLIIEARSEAFGGNLYTSARMTTQNKKQFKFGRIDIRAKLPVTKGMWPALWMLGANISTVPWPACGETDIMEVVGSDPRKLVGTGHYANSAGAHDSRGSSVSLTGEDFSQKFHVFSIIWQLDSIKWLLDDQVYYTMTKSSTGTNNYPFNNDSFFIVNVAVGGDWPGPPDGTTNFPQRMFVDYIRVFQ
ncbi:MAG: family 16 glycosylhydrolase [Ferruginibacter sp.]|nr:family 16 glycosylhydrolase [Ferruginibacter sp.]